MGADLIYSVLVGGLGLLISGTYFVGLLVAGAAAPEWWVRLDSAEGVARRHARRTLGMGIVATVSLATVAGINFINPARVPIHFAVYWLCIAVLLLWLCALALADILHTRRLVRLWQQGRVARLRGPGQGQAGS